MKFKGLWIVILLITLVLSCGLTFVTAWFAFTRIANTAQFPVDQVLSGEIFINNDVRMETSEEEVIPLGEETITLIIDNEIGSVIVQGTETEEIFMTVQKVAWGTSDENAKENLDSFSYDVIQNPGNVTIRFKDLQNVNNRMNEINFKIEVPKSINLDLQTNFGDLYAGEISGNVSLQNNFGNLELLNIQNGDVTVITESGEANLKNILVENKTVRIESGFGNINLYQITAQEINCLSRNGIITTENIIAEETIEVSSDFGDISMREGAAKNLTVKNQGGVVNVSDYLVSEIFTANSDFGSVDTEDVLASQYEIMTKNGNVFLDNANNSKIKIVSDFGNIDLSNVKQATIDLESKNGSITYRGSLTQENHMIQSDFGNISIRLPANQSIAFDLSTSFGTISSEHEIYLTGDMSNNHWVGKLNEGGGLLTIETENGSITLEKTIVED